MLYVFPLTIPANTPETAKQKTTLKLTAGKVTRMMVEFPAGHVGLTHLHINRGLYQIAPANPDASFKSSNETIKWVEDIDLAAPAQFEAYAWNEDDTYDHTITVRIELEPRAETLNLWEEVKSLLGAT